MTDVLPWVALLLVGIAWFFRSWSSSEANNVAAALLREGSIQQGEATQPSPQSQTKDLSRLLSWIVGALLFALLRLGVTGSLGSNALPFCALGALGGELFYRHRKQKRARDAIRRLEFHLPMAMERIVMGVGAGLDIIPAIAEAGRKSDDPVSEIFRKVVRLSERGLPVEQALHSVSSEVPSASVKHALVHLGLAYKQGGEVIRPLKELSDATQTQYQENVEEEIARLPVKAVLPLVITFTGLIVGFLTVPLIQVGSFTAKVTHAAK